MRRFALLVGLVLAACGPSRGRVEGTGFQSGARLAARYDELDGLRVLDAFYDTARAEECAFRVVPGGAVCLPLSAWDDGWFADDACTDKLVEIPSVPAGRTPAQALVVEPVDACDAPPTVYELGPQFPTADAWFRKFDGSCAHGSGGSHPATLRRIGAEVPLDRFVHATVTVERGAGRIGSVVFAADDGARATAFGWDDARGEWSAPALAEDGSRRWWPVHIAFNYGQGTAGTPGTVYADAACTRPTGVKDAHDALCPITSVVEFVAADACTQFTTRLHAAGAAVAPGDLHLFASDGSCASAGVDPNETDALYVEMGDVVGADQFAPVTTVDVGAGRIVQRFDAGADGAPVLAHAFDLYDRQRNVACAPRTAADGARRCLPGGGDLDAVWFADAACTTRIFSISQNVACSGAPAAPAEVTWNGRAWAVVGPVSATTVYSSDGSCSATAPPAGSHWFQLGDEIAPSAYQPATLRTN